MISTNEIRRLTNEVEGLKRKVDRLRSLLISVVGEDREGAYRASIVKELLEAAGEKPSHEYSGSGSLVAQLNPTKPLSPVFSRFILNPASSKTAIP